MHSWVLTEAQLARNPQYGLIDPGIRTLLLFLFTGFSFLFQGLYGRPVRRTHQGGNELWRTREPPGGL